MEFNSFLFLEPGLAYHLARWSLDYYCNFVFDIKYRALCVTRHPKEVNTLALCDLSLDTDLLGACRSGSLKLGTVGDCPLTHVLLETALEAILHETVLVRRAGKTHTQVGDL